MKLLEKIKNVKTKVKNKFTKKESSNQVSNLKIYNVKKRKYSLKKVATIGLTIVIAANLFLAGCKQSEKTYANNTPTIQTQVEDDYNSYIDDSIIKESYVAEKEQTPIIYSEEAKNSYFDSIKEIDVEFSTVDEIYDIDTATNYFSEEITPVENHMYSGFIVNGKVNESKLLESVIENSPKYKEENKDKCLFYSVIKDEKKLKKIISIIAESINNDIPYKTEEEIRELDCTLGSIRIFSNTGLSAAAITEDNVLLINEPMIKMLEINAGNDDGLRHTIYHESKHFEQVNCNDYDDKKYEYQGLSLISDELAKNPYNWSWITEGSAEKGSTNQIGGNDEAYINLIAYVETLDLISIPSAYSTDGNDIETSTFNKELDKFYKLMTADGNISKKEIVEMMYAMEIAQSKVSTYQEDYQKKYGIELSEEEYLEIRYQLRRDFIIECAKIFYSNLAVSINERNDVTLEDIFYLITIFEGDMNYHLEYNDGGKIDTSEKTITFLEEYNDIQEKFFNSLTISNNISISDIYILYNNYGMYVGSDKKEANATLSWINQEKKEWLKEKAEGQRVIYGHQVQQILENIDSRALQK